MNEVNAVQRGLQIFVFDTHQDTQCFNGHFPG